MHSEHSRQDASDKEVVIPEPGLEVVPPLHSSTQTDQVVSLQSEHDKFVEQRPNELIPESGLEVVEQSERSVSEESELLRLREEQKRIHEERQRLARLQTLDQEEERIRRRMNEIAGNNQ
jgi:hypothetical protein